MSKGLALTIILTALTAFVAVNWVYFKILRIAKEKNLVDNPDARKLQKVPIPVMGGIAVFFGLAAGALMGAVLTTSLGITSTAYLLPILMAMVVMLYVGAMDDIVGLTPKSRLVIEILVVLAIIFGDMGCIDSLHGLFGVNEFTWWIAVPLTVFAGVGIINAMNMIDGVNGLSSGLCIVVASLFGAAFIRSGDVSNAIMALIFVASLLPFYIHNVFGNRSRMFIGDAGTMVMGVLMVWFVISVLRSDSPVTYYSSAKNVGLVAMVLAFLSVPVFDTLRVMTMRMLHGKNPFSADKTHLHHAFVAAGVSHFITSTSVILIDITVAAIWSVSVKLGLDTTWQLMVVIIASVFLVWGTYFIIWYNEKNHTPFMHWLSHVSVSTHLGRKEWWKRISAWLDRPERAYSKTDTESDEVLDAIPDKTKVLDYMKGKAEVHVKDIIDYSGVEGVNVYPILYELVHEETIEILNRDTNGVPDLVSMK